MEMRNPQQPNKYGAGKMGTHHCKHTSSFTSTTNHMMSAAAGSVRLLLSSDQEIETFVAAFLCVCLRVCVHPAVTKFITLGMDPALHYTSVDNICREGEKIIINDLIFEICGKGRIWVTSLFSFFLVLFFLPPSSRCTNPGGFQKRIYQSENY